MVCSNEPGYYQVGDFGIRIENLFVVKGKKFEEGNKNSSVGPLTKKFLCFEKITLIPLQQDLMDLDMLEKWEMDWVDDYHKEILAKVEPLLKDKSDAKNWLVRMCKPIERENRGDK